MTYAELVGRIPEEAGISKKTANAALKAMVGAVHDSSKQKEREYQVRGTGHSQNL